MRILVACEYSGAVRDAFAVLGHDVWSCDLLPTERPGNHIQDDALNHLHEDWDLLIAHPPCTHLAVSGAHLFKKKRETGVQQEAIDFFMAFVRAPIRKICVENPVCIMSSVYQEPDQIIHPWQYGHPESKTTCLWLKGLPCLRPTKILPLPPSGRWENQTPSGQNKLGPSPNRAKLRAKTYAGIAEAMADQWTNPVPVAEQLELVT
jgi:hypothetical protein